MNLAILMLAHVVALAGICWMTHADPATAVGVVLAGGVAAVLAYLLGRSDEAEAADQAPQRGTAAGRVR
jgi:hypothetical protein